MQELLETKWKSTRVGTPPLTDTESDHFLSKLENGWVVVNSEMNKLTKTFKFPNFAKALAFINKVGEFAEEKNHHPDLTLTWGKASVTIYTHRIKGLAEMDFVYAAHVEKIYQDNFGSVQ